ncbi:uncharacterized protein LOC110703306 [Chenopodium quinoa]|uniref:uncharacterized protein LOC110703306 n=1 Tax=Chenopodium quinoa TaxID=63459 RepID=UPI000B793422|nr:uncharacterized protein LOC110703306 [Chenopodium quinoa]
MSPMLHDKVISIQEKYGQPSKTRSKKFAGRVYTSIGIPVNSKIMERVEGKWEAHEEEEFKTLFLLLSLEMVLCPTQSPRLACDLFPALTCAMNASCYNWCELVLNKLMESVASFARRFYSTGVAGGCGGCTIFVVVFYLDKLNQFPVQWGEFPRVKVWNMNKIGVAVKRDRFASGGDYGKLGSLDVAYGENHPKDARDSNGPASMTEGVIHEFVQPPGYDNTRRRRGAPKNSISNQVKRTKRRRRSTSEAGSVSPNPTNSSTQPPCDEEPNRCHAISVVGAGSMNWTISSDLEWLLTRLLIWFHNVCRMGLCDGRNLVRMAASTQTEVLFCGAANGLQLLRIINTFIQSPCSQYLALVAQTQDRDVRRSCTWLVAKSGALSLNGEPTQLCVLRADYPSTSYHVVKSRRGSAKEFYAAIYDEWSKHIPCDVIVLAK